MSEYQRIAGLIRSTMDYWRENYDEAKKDLKFQSGEAGSQWNDKEYQDRLDNGRPVVQMDQLDQFVNQVSNAVKANTPQIVVYPGDTKTSKKDADLLKGMVRAIEYNSASDEVYDYACTSAIRCAIGWIRVDYDYKDKYSQEEELSIKKVANPLSVYIDQASVRVDGSDAKFGFIVDEMKRSEFKKRFPKAQPISFSEVVDSDDASVDEEDEMIKVVEFFEVYEDDEVQRLHVKRCFLNGEEIMEEGIFPGKYVPLIPVLGADFWVEKKRVLLSLIRKAKEPQQLYNLWKSTETEVLLKQPLAPFVATTGQVEEYADDYKNPEKVAVLRYDNVDVNGKLAPPPSRMAPPQMSPGIVNAAMGMKDDVKGTMGLYNAALGMQSNETSGKAIQERKAQGDMATYHFGDNLFKSIAQTGKVIVNAIPDVYREAAFVMILNEEEEPAPIGINGELAEGQEETLQIVPNRTFGVKVTTGNSWLSQRQEAAQTMMDMIGQKPELMQVFGDLMFKNLDVPGADVIAKRIKRMIPAELRTGEEEEGEQNPQIEMLTQQIQQAQQQMQMMAQQLEAAKMEIEAAENDQQLKSMSERAKLELDAKKMQYSYEEQLIAHDLKKEELSLKRLELEYKSREAEQANRIDALELTIEQLKPLIEQFRSDNLNME